MKLEGQVGDRRLTGALLQLAESGQTGILTVQGELEIIGISLLDGDVVSADALNQSQEEGLGEILIKRGLVGPDEYGVLVAEHQAGGGRVAELLVERNYLTSEVLLEVMREHIYRLCLQVLGWSEGDFKFYRGDEVAYEQGIAPLSVAELLVRASGELGDGGPLVGSAAESSTIFARGEREPEEAELAADLRQALGEGLGAGTAVVEAAQLLRGVDGDRAADDLAEQCGLELFRALLILQHLHAGEFLRAVGSRAAEQEPEQPEPSFEPEPEAVVAEPRKPRVKLRLWRPEWLDPLLRATSGLLGLGLAASCLALVLGDAGRLLTPFEWQGDLLKALSKERSAALCLRIEEAARTFYLLEGRFPEALPVLVERRLLRISDLLDPAGQPLTYSSDPASYRIHSADSSPTTVSCSGTITGNFLLDPDFLAGSETELAPLVLLD